MELERERGRLAGTSPSPALSLPPSSLSPSLSLPPSPINMLLIFTGLLEQHNKLKQHSSDLEAALAQHEAEIVELHAAGASESRKHDQVDEEQMLKLRQLQEDLSAQASLIDSLQEQVLPGCLSVLCSVIIRACAFIYIVSVTVEK